MLQLRRHSKYPVVQPKLKIGRIGDKYEKEADAVADKVMMSHTIQNGVSLSGDSANFPQMAGNPAIPSVNMKCEECEKEDNIQMKQYPEHINRMAANPAEEDGQGNSHISSLNSPSKGGKYNSIRLKSSVETSANHSSIASDELSGKISNRAGGGLHLDTEINAEMSSKIGTDFSNVRIHTDSSAIEMNQDLGAHAFTHGNDIYFNKGEFNPYQTKGKHLLAHELTHVTQQNGNNDLISCAQYAVGGHTITVDYGGLNLQDVDTQREAHIASRFTGWNGSALTPSMTTALNALSFAQRRWILYGLDLLVDNPQAALNKQTAIERLINYAPNSLYNPSSGNLAAGSFYQFEEEVLRVSGWHEITQTSSLTPTSAHTAGLYSRIFYNPGSSVGSTGTACPALRPVTSQLDEPVMRARLPVLARAYLRTQATNVSGSNVASGNITDIRTIADIIQREALSFFSPYMGRGRTRNFLTNWQYSANLQSSTAPGAIPAGARDAFLRNRADLVGSRQLWSTVNYDPRCTVDQNVFSAIIIQLLGEAQVVADLNTIMSWQSFTNHGPSSSNTVINLQYDSNSFNECEARWRHIGTLCHELIHSYVDQRFFNLHRNRKIIKEGFTEILGDEFYEHLRSFAGQASNAAFRTSLEQGLSASACNGVSIPASVRGYRPASDHADRIRTIEGDPNFRAAYFMGRYDLVGLSPKLEKGNIDSPEEREADTMADRVMNSISGITPEIKPKNPHLLNQPGSGIRI